MDFRDRLCARNTDAESAGGVLNGSCLPMTRHYDAGRGAFRNHRIHDAALPFVARANGSVQKARSPPEDSLAARASRPRKS